MKDIFRFILERKKFILVPVLLVLLLFAVLLILGGGTAFTPFIYSLF